MHQRLGLLGSQLLGEGNMDRCDVTKLFGLSATVAPKNVNRRMRIHLYNIIYGSSARAFAPNSVFKSRFLETDVIGRLAQLRSVVGTILSAGAIEVNCRFFSIGEPRWQRIIPKAGGVVGFRGHARAFFPLERFFEDFLLSEIREIRSSRERRVSASYGHELNAVPVLEVGPDRASLESQVNVSAHLFGMSRGKAKIGVWVVLLCYALRHLGLDSDPDARKSRDQQPVLVSKEAVYEVSG